MVIIFINRNYSRSFVSESTFVQVFFGFLASLRVALFLLFFPMIVGNDVTL